MSTFTLVLSVVAISFSGLAAQAKRLEAPVVKPIKMNGVQYSYEIEKLTKDCPSKNGCGDRVFVTAKKAKAEKWKTEVYQTVYDEGLETDVQQIHPAALRFGKNGTVELRDEKGGRYVLNRTTGSRVKPSDVHVYSGP